MNAAFVFGMILASADKIVVRDDDGDISIGFDKWAWHTHADLLAS